jgi:hypothetical protein
VTMTWLLIGFSRFSFRERTTVQSTAKAAQRRVQKHYDAKCSNRNSYL